MTQFTRPCDGRITSYYGRRLHPIHKVMMGHHGIDIAASGRVPVKAAAAGKVSRVLLDGTPAAGGYGNCIMIKHPNGMETVYAHLASFSVSLHQDVSQGQQIGIMGNTGNSTGQHLHFEIHKSPGWNNKYTNEVNPLHYYVDPDVKRLQQLLINVGQKIAVDGEFGPATEAAVKAFQKAAGLVVDGSAGPATLAALEKFASVKVAADGSKGDEDLKFTSKAARELWETFIESKAQREIVIQAAVDAGYSDTWIQDLKEGKVEPGDFAGLMAGTIVKQHKQNN
ncbi:peptidoglycan DD-metalloendopeptidase family protein [Sporosarcina sp. FSL W7-1349]|uniref:peptidoglycan DD-metalloendopeptidase family protein n=1 Tax=Sporosarcina sp. FSL W7-1349 TaxID=2921561 RepID=UPI0030F529E2